MPLWIGFKIFSVECATGKIHFGAISHMHHQPHGRTGQPVGSRQNLQNLINLFEAPLTHQLLAQIKYAYLCFIAVLYHPVTVCPMSKRWVSLAVHPGSLLNTVIVLLVYHIHGYASVSDWLIAKFVRELLLDSV